VIVDISSVVVYACGAFLLWGENRFCYRFLCANRILQFTLAAVIVANITIGLAVTFLDPGERGVPVRLIFGLMILIPFFYGAVAPFTRNRYAPVSIIDVSA
jgi:hypothetical protein